MAETQVVEDVGGVAPKTEEASGETKLISIDNASKLMGATFVMTLMFSDWLFAAGEELGQRFEAKFPTPVDFFQHMAPWVAEAVSKGYPPVDHFNAKFKELLATVKED
jgi:hypothetical protein